MSTPILLELCELRTAMGQHVNLKLRGGEIHCISGPSGGGKTRLLRAITDLEPAEGSVTLREIPKERYSAAQWRQKIMLSPAQPRWWLSTAAQHCLRDMTADAAALNMKPDRLHAAIDQLSTGEQARAGLLRALSHDPEILLLDEPTGALDAKSAAATEVLLRPWLTPQRAILWVGHDADQIERIADQHWELRATALCAL
jgi:sulfonate transport system ATP-binding protein